MPDEGPTPTKLAVTLPPSASPSGRLESLTELCAPLGCRGRDEFAVILAVTELCRWATSRFGTPEACRAAIALLIGAPNDDRLHELGKDLPSDMRWESLAPAIVPPVKDGFPIGMLRTTSDDQLAELKKSVAALAADLRDLRLKPIDPIVADALKGSIEEIRATALELGEPSDVHLMAVRQLEIYHEVGRDWAWVTPFEHFFLMGCARSQDPDETAAEPTRSTPPLDRSNRDSPPSNDLLNHLGLMWVWSDKRKAWEPCSLKSEFSKSTLFDLSSYYFKARLKDGTVRPPASIFFKELLDARLQFERREIGGPSLQEKQNKCLAKALT